MKLLFTHDNKFYVDSAGIVYSNGQFSYSLWKKYLQVFESIDIGARIYNLSEDMNKRNLSVSSGPKVSFYNIPSLNSPINKVINNYRASKVIVELLEKNDFLITRLPSEIGLLSSTIANKSNKKWSVEVVGCAFRSYWYHGSLLGKLYAPYIYYKTKKKIGKAKYCLYVTQEFLQKTYPNNGENIGLSDVMIGSNDLWKLNLNKRKADLTNKKVIIGLMGSIVTKHKGIDTAVYAMKLLKDSKINVEFRILGEGDHTDVLRLAKKLNMQNNIVFCGIKANGKEVFEWLDELDIYIQPSITEGLPRAVIEAMSRGCPIIASDVGGMNELISKECLHKPKRPSELSVLLLKMVQDSSWRVKQSNLNKQNASLFEEKLLNVKRVEFWENFKQS